MTSLQISDNTVEEAAVPPLRVVLIEDSDLTRCTIRAALEQQDYICILAEATTAEAGLAAITDFSPDIAILNVGLPDLDGIELTRRIKEMAPTRVLILSGRDREETVLAAFAAGADAYCLKEVSADNLLLALQKLQEGNSWIDPAIAHIVLQQIRTGNPAAPESVTIAAAKMEYAEILEISPLTERELEVLAKIVEGYSNAQIAADLQIGLGTVKTHVRNILDKLCASDRTQAAVRALRSGLVK
jgi:DNA-binding NarL/FixJ family response regulator